MYDFVASAPMSADMTMHPFWLFDWSQVGHVDVAFCSVILFLSGVLCSAAGIGGGGIYVAVLMVAGGLTPHDAVPLSKAIVFLGSLASLILNIRRSLSTDAKGSKPSVIDYDVCRQVVPTALMGTLLGVLLNRRLSGSTIVFVLTSLLVFMTFMVTRTAVQQYLAELKSDVGSGTCQSREDAAPASRTSSLEDAEPASELSPLVPLRESKGAAQTGDPKCAFPPALNCKSANQKGSKSSEIARKDIILAGMVLMVVACCGVLNFHMEACRAEALSETAALALPDRSLQSKARSLLSARSTESADAFIDGAIDAADAEYIVGHIQGACAHPLLTSMTGSRMRVWMGDTRIATFAHTMVLMIPLGICMLFAMFYGSSAMRDRKWTMKDVASYQSMACATGVLAGLVGVGGGLIFSPFFLIAGLDPSVAVGTSATCVIFTSSSTTFQYIFTDRIVMSLALAYGAVNIVASFIGTSLVHVLQDKFSARKSYITFIVAGGVALSTLLSLVKFAKLSFGHEPIAHLF